MSNNIIDKIQVSGVTYTLSAETGGGGITSGEVQTMIDQSTSGKAETTAVTEAISEATSGKVDTTTYTAYTAATDERISQDEEVTAAGLNALNDKITPTVELTQAQYDALVTAGTVAQDTYYIITDAQAGDLTNYYTKSETNTLLGGKADTATTYTKTEVDNAITAGTSTKQDTLVSGTNIKTINNTSLLGSGNIDIQGGGGGKAVAAGTNISVTTGETADTINCTLPIYISSNVDKGDINIGTNNNANSNYYNIAIGRKIDMSQIQGGGSIVIATPTNNTTFYNKCYGGNNVGIGTYIQIGERNSYSGARHNCVVIGNEAKSLINQGVAIGYDTVATGTTKTNINNQLKIDTSNQVYIYNKDNTEMICLQDNLGGGGASYSAGTGIDITNNVISVSGVVETSAITTSVSSSSTDSQVPSAKAVYDQLGGLKLVKLSQSEYDSLATKDNSTLYVIVN